MSKTTTAAAEKSTTAAGLAATENVEKLVDVEWRTFFSKLDVLRLREGGKREDGVEWSTYFSWWGVLRLRAAVAITTRIATVVTNMMTTLLQSAALNSNSTSTSPFH